MGASPIPLVAVLFALLAVVLVQGSISLLKVNESTGKCVGYQIVTSSGISIIMSVLGDSLPLGLIESFS